MMCVYSDDRLYEYNISLFAASNNDTLLYWDGKIVKGDDDIIIVLFCDYTHARVPQRCHVYTLLLLGTY